tara:strand:+ start:3104 stop:3349 length:246 start_codon:yes stop_codon:yes gene_type:complete
MTNITNSSEWVISTNDGVIFSGVVQLTPDSHHSTNHTYVFTADTEDELMEKVFVSPEREELELPYTEPQYVIKNLTPKPLP